MSSLSSTLLYTASLLSALTVAGHSKMGFDTVFPSLTKVPAGGLRDLGAGAARIGWWEVNQDLWLKVCLQAWNDQCLVWRREMVLLLLTWLAILCAKWAKFGVAGPYEKALLGMFTVTQLIAAVSYYRLGAKDVATTLVVVPTLVGLSQVL